MLKLLPYPHRMCQLGYLGKAYTRYCSCIVRCSCWYVGKWRNVIVALEDGFQHTVGRASRNSVAVYELDEQLT